MRIPEFIRKCVVFLSKMVDKGQRNEFYLCGTGFIVSMPSRVPHRRFLYVVTARHVAQTFFGQPVAMRVNMKRGHSEYLIFDNPWVYHPTEPESTDAAVLAFDWINTIDIGALPIDMFLTDQLIADRQIGAGDEVFVVGVFSKMQGEKRSIPFVRTGNVAAMPDRGEKIPNVNIREWRGDVEGYLVETRSLGGLSGSPVFVRETLCLDIQDDPTSPVGRRPFHGVGASYLMGLMHGHWFIKDQDKNDVIICAVEEKHPDANIVGISVVVPAQKILEILRQPSLVEARAKQEATWSRE